MKVGEIYALMRIDKRAWDKAINESKAQLKNFGDKVEQNSQKIKSMGRKMVVAGGLMLGTAFKLAQMAGVQTLAENKLATALNNVEGATRGAEKELIKYAANLQKITGYGDEEIITAQAMLASFQLNEKQIKALTPRLLDMAAATEKATGQQADLQTIAIALGKGVTGQAGQLARYGVVLSEQTKKTGNFTDIMRDLDKNFKGQAETLGKSYIGQLRGAKAALGDVAEKLGATLIPVLTKFLEGVTKTAQKIGGWISEHKALVGTILKVVAGLGALLVPLGTFLVILPSLVSGIKMVSTVLTTGMGPIAAYTAALIAAVVAAQAISKWMGKVAENTRKAMVSQYKFQKILTDGNEVIKAGMKALTKEQKKELIKQRLEWQAAGESRMAVAHKTMLYLKKNVKNFAEIERKKREEIKKSEQQVKQSRDEEKKIDYNLSGLKNALRQKEKQEATQHNYDIYAKMAEAAAMAKKKRQELSDFIRELLIAEKEARGEDYEVRQEQLLLEYDQKKRLLEEEYQGHVDQKDALLALENWYNAELDKLDAEHNEKKLTGLQKWATEASKIMEKVQKLTAKAFAAMRNISQALLNSRLNHLQRWYDKQKQTILNSQMSEEEKAKAIEKLDKEYEAKKTAAQRSAAKREKAIAIMEAIVNTAAGVTKAWAQGGGLFGAILAAIVAAAGAAQIAAIKAQPLPMAEGGMTKGEGLALLHPNEVVMPLEKIQEDLNLGGGQPINIYINALDAENMEEAVRMRVVPEIQRAINSELITLTPGSVR